MDSYSDHHKYSDQRPNHRLPSNSELMSSAKLVAEAAQHTFRHESDKVDKQKVAGAAADLLGAASHYGKLEEKGFGKYIDQAENYLHKYGQSSSHSSGTGTAGHSSGHSVGTGSAGYSHSDYSEGHAPKKEQQHSGDNEDGGSNYGDYIKLAQGFLKKF